MADKLDPVAPGEILLEEFMKPFGVSQNKLARDIDVPVTRINEGGAWQARDHGGHGPASRLRVWAPILPRPRNSGSIFSRVMT